MISNLTLQIFYMLAFSSMVAFVTGYLYPDSDFWEPDILLIAAVVFLIDFVWLSTYLLRS